MLPLKDLLLIIVSLTSIVVGITLPEFGAYFEPFPLAAMMMLLFLSFLSIDLKSIWHIVTGMPHRMLLLLFLKMVLIPAIVYVVFHYFLPDYALSALLLSGIASGVTAPFYCLLLQGNTPLVLVMVVLTSILAPFTLPALVKGLAGHSIHIPLLDMVRILSFIIFIPLVCVEFLKRTVPELLYGLIRVRFTVSLILIAVCCIGVFSSYSGFIRSNPSIILSSLGIACVLAVFYILLGLLFTMGRPVEDQLAGIISIGLMNNVLVVIFSSRFFGPVEATVAALYSLPFVWLIVPLRIYRNICLRRGKAPRTVYP